MMVGMIVIPGDVCDGAVGLNNEVVVVVGVDLRLNALVLLLVLYNAHHPKFKKTKKQEGTIVFKLVS